MALPGCRCRRRHFRARAAASLEAPIAFLDTWNFEQAVRSAISLGGDADTQAAIAGAAAAALDGSGSDELVEKTRRLLGDDMLDMLEVPRTLLRRGGHSIGRSSRLSRTCVTYE